MVRQEQAAACVGKKRCQICFCHSFVVAIVITQTYNNLLLLTSNLTDDQTLVLGAQEDLMSVKTKEGLSGVLAGNLLVVQDSLTSRVATSEQSIGRSRCRLVSMLRRARCHPPLMGGYSQSCELGEVVDERVDDDPKVALLVVLGNLCSVDLLKGTSLLLLCLRGRHRGREKKSAG